MELSPDQFGALVEAGIIGKVEYLGGRMLMAGIPMSLSPEQRAAAADAGIELPPSDVPDAATVEAVLNMFDPNELRSRATGPVVGLAELEESQ